MESNSPGASSRCGQNFRPSAWTLATFLLILMLVNAPAFASTFGTVVPIGAQASDIALDETRGVVYVANYTANRLDVVSITTRRLLYSINVGRQPAALALSPNGQYLAITHVAEFIDPATAYKGLTVFDLNAGGNMKQTFMFNNAPLGAMFGIDGQLLILTTQDLLLFDPTTGYSTVVGSVSDIGAKALPQPAPKFPREIIRASLVASGDGTRIYGVASPAERDNEALLFGYDVTSKQIMNQVRWLTTPPLGPRVVSTDQTGSYIVAGYGLFDKNGFPLLAELPAVEGKFEIGSHVVDSIGGIVYAQVRPPANSASTPASAATANTDSLSSYFAWMADWLEGAMVRSRPINSKLLPLLAILDADNLTVREELLMPENMAGRSILSSNRDMLYAVSDSGLMILPVGSLNQQHRVAAAVEDVVITGNWCDRNSLVKEFRVANPGGGSTDFVASSNNPGVLLSASSATTPATVRVTVDMNAYKNNAGTTAALVTFSSRNAINRIPPVRVLINNREPDQRGTMFNVPGKLVDLAADSQRNRFYVLRLDKNQVQVFDATNYRQIGTLRTGNTPWSMAITQDRKYLIVGVNHSQVARVFDLDTLKLFRTVVFPGGHYPRSIATSNGQILAVSRNASPQACGVGAGEYGIDTIDILSGRATSLPSLGIWCNDVAADSVLTSSPSGKTILLVQPNGLVMTYDADADTFVAARQDFSSFTGAYGALSDDTFVVGNYVFNWSLVFTQLLDATGGTPSGIAVADGNALRTSSPHSASPGMMQRAQIADDGVAFSGARIVESPLIAPAAPPDQFTSLFTRTLAPLYRTSAIVSLTTGGFTALPWNYDAAIADPRINAVVNAADSSARLAPGGLISVYGTSLSPVNAATSTMPLPTLLGDSCLSINGALVPMLFVSGGQINAQMPYNVLGNATVTLHTPSGTSNSLNIAVNPTGPAVFRVAFDGWSDLVPTVVRLENGQFATLSNPVHLDDWLVIYATGLGAVNPSVDAGDPAPADPLASALMQPTVTLGGTQLSVGYAGLVPSAAGLYQINVKVPFRDVPTGMSVPLTIKQGDASSTVSVRVVD